MIEIEYQWRDVFEHLKIFRLGESILINKVEHRLVGSRVLVRNGANVFLKLTYVTDEEMKGVFGTSELYDADFTGGE